MAEHITRTVQTGRHETFYHRMGQGNEQVILFLHGSGPGVSAWSNWQFALPALSDQFDCIAPDLLGFGQSAHPADPPQTTGEWLELWLDQVVSLLDQLGLAQVNLVGNSMGGGIALQLLTRSPERFSKTTLMGSLGVPFLITEYLDRGWGFYRDPSLEELEALIRGFVSDADVIGGDISAIARGRWQDVQQPHIRRSFSAMFGQGPQAAVDALVVPTGKLTAIQQQVLVTQGREDRYIPLTNGFTLVQQLPNAQLHVFDHCGHWIQIERRYAFNALLRAFFSGQLD